MYHGLESIPFLAILNMSMVALATLIVIAHESLTACPIKEAVLELMSAAVQRGRHFPYLHFDNCAIPGGPDALERILDLLDQATDLRISFGHARAKKCSSHLMTN